MGLPGVANLGLHFYIISVPSLNIYEKLSKKDKIKTTRYITETQNINEITKIEFYEEMDAISPRQSKRAENYINYNLMRASLKSAFNVEK